MTPRNFASPPVLTPDELFSTFTQQIVPCTMYPCPMYPITLSRIRDVRFVHFQKGDEGPGSRTEFRLLILGSFRISISCWVQECMFIHSSLASLAFLPFLHSKCFCRSFSLITRFYPFWPRGHRAFVKERFKYFWKDFTFFLLSICAYSVYPAVKVLDGVSGILSYQDSTKP